MRIDEWNGPHLRKKHPGEKNITNTASEEDKKRALEELRKMQEKDEEDGVSVITFLDEDGKPIRL